MTESVTEEPKGPFDPLEAAEAQFRDMADELRQAGYAARMERTGDLAASKLAAKNLMIAAQQYSEERAKVEKLRKQTGEFAAGHDFDLDAARAEIGLRLACLRHAAGH